MPKPRKDGGERVGYKRPPKATQFKPGQSGNPRGRPKGSFNLATRVRQMAMNVTTITIDGRTQKMSMLDAFLMTVPRLALKNGDQKLISVCIDLWRWAFASDRETDSDSGKNEEALRMLQQLFPGGSSDHEPA